MSFDQFQPPWVSTDQVEVQTEPQARSKLCLGLSQSVWKPQRAMEKYQGLSIIFHHFPTYKWSWMIFINDLKCSWFPHQKVIHLSQYSNSYSNYVTHSETGQQLPSSTQESYHPTSLPTCHPLILELDDIFSPRKTSIDAKTMLSRRVFLLTIEIGRDFVPKVAPPSYKLVHNNLPVRLYLKPNSCRGHFRLLNWGT